MELAVDRWPSQLTGLGWSTLRRRIGAGSPVGSPPSPGHRAREVVDLLPEYIREGEQRRRRKQLQSVDTLHLF